MTTAHTTISRRRHRTAAASEVAPVGIPSPTGAAPTRSTWITTNINGAIVVQAMEGHLRPCRRRVALLAHRAPAPGDAGRLRRHASVPSGYNLHRNRGEVPVSGVS